MKRILTLTLAILLLAFAAGCGAGGSAKELDVAALASELSGADIYDDILSEVPSAAAARFYGCDEADIVSCALYQSTAAAAEEVFVAQCADEAAAGRVKAGAEARVASQITAYESYVPAEVPKLEAAVLEQSGVYVIFAVTADAAAAQSIVDGYLK